MTNRPVGADDTTGEFSGIVETRLQALIDAKVLVEKNRAEGVEGGLQDQIDDILDADLVARATDGSFGLSAPTGVGFEAVITGNALQDFRFDGNDL